MKSFKQAFTMIELVFVIVVLGILASVAIPRLSVTRVDAQVTKCRSDISAIRSAIVSERQSRLIKGDNSWISELSGLSNNYFDGVDENHTLLMYGIKPKDVNGHWYSWDSNNHTYKFKIEDEDNTFTYDPSKGTFLCISGSKCLELMD
ncbi:MAG: type II secretion system protein [Campylobacterales bacterium]|jgi:general secretion pathway protein G